MKKKPVLKTVRVPSKPMGIKTACWDWKICRRCGGRFKDPMRHYCPDEG